MTLASRACLSVTFLCVFAAASVSQVTAQSSTDAEIRRGQFVEIRARAVALGGVRVIVSLRMPPEGTDARISEPGGLDARRAAVASVQAAVLAALGPVPPADVRLFELTPGLAFTATAGLVDLLEVCQEVVGIKEDGLAEPLLASSVPIIRADQVTQLGTTGAGVAIVVLDTGVDAAHADFGGRVVSEACFSTNNSFLNATTLCPGGVTSSTAAGSGENCSASVTGCDHGTHVASIAARVAPQADLISMQVFSRIDDGLATPCADSNSSSPCTRSFESDRIAAMSRVVTLSATRKIAAVNMSLGGGQFAGPCDGSFTNTRDMVNLLRSLGIAVVAASGNSGFRNAMGAPACLSNVISVGNTTDADLVASSSNVSTLTTLFAPGSGITAAVPQASGTTAPTRLSKSGTSMAAPHVAGVLALLRQELKGVATPSIVADLTTRIRTTGPLITDQRTSGVVNFVRRLDALSALCTIVSCDSDDFRIVTDDVAGMFGSITPVGERDYYYYLGIPGERLRVDVTTRSGPLDPVLEVLDPGGQRVAIDDNGGDGNNAQVSGLTLQQGGRYTLVVRDAGAGTRTGTYMIRLARELLPLYPVPRITTLDPAAVTATSAGSDFWLAVRGSGFTRQTQAQLASLSRAVYYSSASLVYVRVLASDVNFPAPRSALLVLRNPTPNGGLSAAYLPITVPRLGTFDFTQPAARYAPVGAPTALESRWVAPNGISWRTMQRMDMRLRNEQGAVAAWVRVVERPGTTSLFRLINEAGELVGEGLPGTAGVLEIPGVVSLDLATSTFTGSGDTAIMKPTLTFGAEAVGLYNVEFEVDNDQGDVQAEDVLGLFRVLPVGCTVPVGNLTLTGPATALPGASITLTAAVSPAGAAAPISYSWAPEPEAGQGTAVATYRWRLGGVQPVNVTATNCGGFVAAGTQVTVPATSLLAEGAGGWFFDLDVLVANPHTEDVPFSLTYLLPSGPPLTRQHIAPAQSRRTIRVSDDPALAGESAVSTVVQVPSGLPLAVERTMFWDKANHYAGHGGTAVQEAATRWYFAEGSQGFFDTWLLLANPGPEPAVAQVTFLREHEAPYTVSVTLAPNSRESVFAGTHPPLINRSFSIEVSADLPVIAERAMYWTSQGRQWNGGHESAGVAALSRFWFLAEGATGDYFDMYVLLGNPGQDATTATLTFLLSDGTTVVRAYDVPARRRLTINVEDQDPRLKHAEVSVTVSSGDPIVVERAMYWPGTSATWQDAHDSFGVTETGTAWMLAEGRAGTVQKYETFVLIANPSTVQDAEITLTFLREAGVPLVRTLTVPASSRRTVWASAIPELAHSNFGVVIESGNEVPVVVERAMYWDAVGQHWAGGINTTATRLR